MANEVQLPRSGRVAGVYVPYPGISYGSGDRRALKMAEALHECGESHVACTCMHRFPQWPRVLVEYA